jgi:putative ABC transport system permease protein
LHSTPSINQATARLQTFALVSVDEQSAGALVMGVDVVNEKQMSTLPNSVFSGRYLSEQQGLVPEVYMGRFLARNLGADLGDDVVVLGSQKDGAVAALVLRLVGVFDSGQTELDRSLLQIPIEVFREEFGLGDDAHILAFNIEDINQVDSIAEQLRIGLDENLRVYTWQDLMPELQQTIDMKQSGMILFFGLLVLMVTFSIVNTYIMTVAERTPEFGMLLAIGMKPWSIIGMLVFEALFVGLLGVALGVIISGALVAVLSHVGIPLPAEVADLMRAYHMPDRLYPGWSWSAAFHAGWIILLSTQLAAFLSTLKIRKLVPIEAMFRRA